MPRSRNLLSIPAAIAALAVLAPAPGPALAQSSVLPIPGVCVKTGVLPDLGTCPGQTPAPPAADPAPSQDAPAPPKAKKKKKKKTTRACTHTDRTPSSANDAKVRRAILCLVNRERARKRRPALKANSTLATTARRYGTEMVRESFFDHVSPAGSTLKTRVQRTSYLRSKGLRRWSLGENLAWGTGDLGTPEQIVASWMRSRGHRRNILDKEFREIGIGAVVGVPEGSRAGTSEGATYVTVFGARVKR